ncbi:MAG: hypothetical protein RLZZ44_382 [Bacteroidota bacterium]|jgi:hypothetical protein
MKKIILSLIVLMTGMIANAQVDIITKHSGEIVKGKVVRVEEYTVVYKYDGEDVENSIGKYAIQKIVYGKSGREEEFTDKIIINGEEDWEKVVILEDKAYISGLKKGEEIRGKTGFVSFHTGNTADKKAEKKLKMEAAKGNYPFVLLVSDKQINQSGAQGPSFGAVQSVKTGVSYKY